MLASPAIVAVGQEYRQPVTSQLILIVEDDLSLRQTIDAGLVLAGFETRSVSTAEEAFDTLARESVDLILLDVYLPGRSGFEAAASIRQRSDIPIIFMTGAGSLSDRLQGFELGADDYVVKPIELIELRSRVRAVLRRSQSGDNTVHVEPLRGPGGVEIDVPSRQAFVEGHELQLTAKEFGVLRTLLEQQGVVLTVDALASAVWGYETYGSRNFVDAHVSRLRRKLREHGSGDVITTVRGVGFVIRPEADA